MRVETDRPEVATALTRTVATLRAADGFVADDFTIRERDGHISCAISERIGEAGRLLVSYPRELTVPMHVLAWADRPDAIELADPAAARGMLTRTQWRLLIDWLRLINAVDRVAHVRAALPRYAITDPTLRHHLADAGHPTMREFPTDSGLAADVRETVISWHSMGGGQDPDGTQRWRLIPLKHLVNHHPAGADQNPDPGRTAVATSATSDDVETFENYGDLDAMQLLMNFGYVDSAAPQVHSVPVEVESAALGRIVVRWRAPRNPRAEVVRDVPTISRLWSGATVDEDARVVEAASPAPGEGLRSTPTRSPGTPERIGNAGHGIELRHLTIRPGNRARVAAYLAMACQSLAGMNADNARRQAEAVLDSIFDANQTYYRRLDELVVASTDPFLPLAEVSLLQQQRLTTMWG